VPTTRDAQRIQEQKPSKVRSGQPVALYVNLRSPVLKGYVLHYAKGASQPEIVRGADGMPVLRPELIDSDTWTSYRLRLTPLPANGQGNHAKGTLLLRVAYCRECGKPMHSERKTLPAVKPSTCITDVTAGITRHVKRHCSPW